LTTALYVHSKPDAALVYRAIQRCEIVPDYLADKGAHTNTNRSTTVLPRRVLDTGFSSFDKPEPVVGLSVDHLDADTNVLLTSHALRIRFFGWSCIANGSETKGWEDRFQKAIHFDLATFGAR
jgi:hypothetical protein